MKRGRVSYCGRCRTVPPRRFYSMARVADIVLLDHQAGATGPRCINCYSVELERFDAIDGTKFKLDQSRLVYSLQWKHNAHPPDFELVLVQDGPQQ